ncbi:hypothetical protein SAMN04488544_2023 [Microlunatus sagamiharensis]|uniref:Uncharacterized protein n=1 Tax=Microlunatus sagamiharensis TaxID=546874 RepID=A0A1H2MGR3_9ACTN|nr:hypothetical protein [Microlunatus sagamiharensis]SDU92274.1 hypothetical protein SAMN04488544_2023 [Microlunatus sagamiharensis]
MDADGNVKTSTLVVGVAVALALTLLCGALADAFAPRLLPWAFVPALVFVAIYVRALRRRGTVRGEEPERR